MNNERIAAVMRMLSDSGDITPMAQRQIQNVMNADPELRHVEEVSPDEHLQIVVTEEGIIIDAFLAEDVVGTMGMTFDEWYDYVKGR